MCRHLPAYLPRAQHNPSKNADLSLALLEEGTWLRHAFRKLRPCAVELLASRIRDVETPITWYKNLP
jgi:hypothetical protein